MKYTYRSSKFTLICDHIDEILIFVNDEVLAKMPQKPCYNYKWKKILKFWGKCAKFQNYTGLLIFRGKKSKISRDFQGQIRGKIGRFRGIFAGKKSKFAQKSAHFAWFSLEKSQNSQKNRPISRDFSGKSQISKDFRGKFLEKSADFTGNFGGKLRQETISKKQPISLDFFWQISLKSINFASIWPALVNVFFNTDNHLLFQQQFAREISAC